MKLFIAFLFSAVIAFVAAEENTAATNVGEIVGEDVKALDKKIDATFDKEWNAKVPFFNKIVEKLKEHGIDASQMNEKSIKWQGGVKDTLRGKRKEGMNKILGLFGQGSVPPVVPALSPQFAQPNELIVLG